MACPLLIRPRMRLTWDRGTLLLHGTERVDDLPDVLWDPRVRAFRAPARAHAALVEALRARGVPVRDEAVPRLPAPPPFPPPELRPYQQAAVAAWELAGGRGVVALPTGAGKTRTALAAIAGRRARTLILVPTRVLLEQWLQALAAAGAREVGRYGDGARDEGPLTVATFASATRHAEALGNRFDLLVADEAHHFGGGENELLELCTAPLRLGLTATPPEDPVRLATLERLVGPVVFRSTVEALAGRWLAPFRVLQVSVSLTAEERAAYDAEVAVYRPAVRRFFEDVPGASWSDFVAAASRSDAGARALAAWRRSRDLLAFPSGKRRVLADLLARHASSRVLVFAADTATAYAVARAHLVPVITSDIGRAERARLLDAFARGALRVLVSARVLNEGVDVPAADVAVVLGGSQGAREHVQRVGRVLRPAEGKEALVYDVVARGTHEVVQAAVRREALHGP